MASPLLLRPGQVWGGHKDWGVVSKTDTSLHLTPWLHAYRAATMFKSKLVYQGERETLGKTWQIYLGGGAGAKKAVPDSN